MISVRKAFTLPITEVGRKFRVENNNLDITALIEESGFDAVKVSEVAWAHRENRKRPKTRDVTFKYVQISDIDTQLGRIRSFTRYVGAKAPNNARRIMKSGDVLVSTRRPTRGAVVAVPDDFDGDICTVFFTTLRVRDRTVLDPRYLALFLRTSLGRFQFQSAITETAYPVISDEDVEDMTVLLPSLADQVELVQNYDAGVQGYVAKMNEAFRTITDARQNVENAILGEEAETLEPIQFGLGADEEEADSEDADE